MRDKIEQAAQVNSIDTHPTDLQITEEEADKLTDGEAHALGAAIKSNNQVVPYWFYRRMLDMGVDMSGTDYDITQYKEPKQGGVVRYQNRAARRAAARAHR